MNQKILAILLAGIILAGGFLLTTYEVGGNNVATAELSS